MQKHYTTEMLLVTCLCKGVFRPLECLLCSKTGKLLQCNILSLGWFTLTKEKFQSAPERVYASYI